MVQSGLSDHDKPCVAWRIAKGLVEIGIDAGADSLQCQAHRLAGNGHKTLETQDVVGTDHFGNLSYKCIGIRDFAACDDEAFEFVVAMFMRVVMVVIVIIVVMVVVVHLMAAFQIAFRADPLAQQLVLAVPPGVDAAQAVCPPGAPPPSTR